jgi:predicted ATP-grasp superfamily ATP-dependent carboligase
MNGKEGGHGPAALLVGGPFNALGAARNLAAHGVRVYVVDHEPCVTRFSRHVRRFYKSPPPAREVEFIDFLVALARQDGVGGSVLFLSDDARFEVVARHRERLAEHYRVTVPPWEMIKFLYDKRLIWHLAEEVGVPIPGTANPRSVEELDALELGFPVVLKPAITTHLSSATKKKAYRADDKEELFRTYEMLAAIIDPREILVQELIPGRAEKLYSYAGFFRRGSVVAGFAARRPRQHPMEFGRASTFVEVVKVPELEGLSERLLTRIDYTGLAEVEFMYDGRHERFELLEVNPRLWGWHSIALRAGLELPYLAYADALGQDHGEWIPENGERVKWIRLLTDVPTAAVEIAGGRLSLRDYLTSLSGDVEWAVLSLDDPLPFIVDLALLPYYFKHRGF